MDKEIQKALSLHKIGKLDEAESLYLDILSKSPKDFSILQLLGTLYFQKENLDLSKKYLQKSININPNNAATLNNLGNLEKKLKNYSKAHEYFETNIEKNNYLASWINKSNIFIDEEKYREGLNFIKTALTKYPEDIKLRNNYAIFLFNCGYKDECLKIYKDFENRNLHFDDSLLNYSKVLYQIKSYEKALETINFLLYQDNKNLKAIIQRFLIYKDIKKFNLAEKDLIFAKKIFKNDFIINKILVDFYLDRKKFTHAIPYCDQMINVKNNSEYFVIMKIICKIHLGLWENLTNDLKLFEKNNNKELFFSPFRLMYFSDDPLLKKKIAENYWSQKIDKKYLNSIDNLDNNIEYSNKIRIGYFSGDFRDHPVYHLIHDLFLNYDRSIFEIYIYSSYKKAGLEREKIFQNVDYFFDIDDNNDEETLRLVKSHSLDVAIDLSGYTLHSKSDLFYFDIAKIKINYLGFPGTMGTDKYDYIICDKIVIPDKDKNFYSEKLLYLNQNFLPYSPFEFMDKPNRKLYNLPNNALILGCLTRIEKILPNIFDIWMNILKKYSDIYLVLNIQSEEIKLNIQKYCDQNKFNSKQLIFLKHLESREDYLKRMSTFDLYLDTFPYNGHTMIAEALYQSCVPVVSLNGKSYASRVSLSILKTLDLEDLSTNNFINYFNKIDYFCSNREELNKIKKYLIEYKKKNINRMEIFTKDFENKIINILKNKNIIKKSVN